MQSSKYEYEVRVLNTITINNYASYLCVLNLIVLPGSLQLLTFCITVQCLRLRLFAIYIYATLYTLINNDNVINSSYYCIIINKGIYSEYYVVTGDRFSSLHCVPKWSLEVQCTSKAIHLNEMKCYCDSLGFVQFSGKFCISDYCQDRFFFSSCICTCTYSHWWLEI